MDYEKKYKALVGRIKKARLNAQTDSTKAVLDDIMCAMEESEDERMLRVLREGFNILDKDDEWYSGITNGQILAWLEKQGEQEIKKKPIWKHWKNGIAGNGEGKQIYLIKSGDSYTLSSCLGYECDYIELSDLDEFMLSEKQDKNHADKVEPKFRVEDWVACNSDDLRYLLRIVSISDKEYRTEDIQGVSARPKIWYLDKYYHRWTINDAKDGDVLIFEDHGGVVAGIVSFVNERTGKVDVYCLLEDNRFKHGNFYALDTINPHPATKEQRDFLFEKMYEAGYEWDAERKKVKKIEQKPAERSLPYGKNETAEKLIALAECLEMDGDCLFNGLSGNDYGKFLRVLAKELTEIKSAEWSEEDEQLIDEVAVCLRKYAEKVQGGYSKFYVQSLADRIESLRPGNTCKATGWSEEDEKVYQSIMDDTVQENQLDEKQINWLRSLKQKLTWKPSEEQMKLLGWVAEQNKDNMIGKELMTLYNDLKNNFYGE